MLYGWRSADGRWLAHSRVSNSTVVESRSTLTLADHVYIGHHGLIDASGGLRIDEGVQICSHCIILTHSSHRAVAAANIGGPHIAVTLIDLSATINGTSGAMRW